MRILLLLMIISSCSALKGVKGRSESAPAWVEGVRNGQESLKVSYGNKMLYRRIASSEKSDKHACEMAILKAEEDVKREFPLFPTIPYTLEVLFYDQEYKDCAATISL